MAKMADLICEKRGYISEDLAAYLNALLIEPNNVPCKILLGARLSKFGTKMLSSVRTLLSNAWGIEPTSSLCGLTLNLF